MEFSKFIEALAERLGIEIEDAGGAAAIEVNGVDVILQDAGKGLLFIHADLGEVAPDIRENILQVAMDANFLYQGTGGATLARNPRDGHLYLQRYNWLERLDVEQAMTAFEHLVDTVMAWQAILADGAALSHDASSAASDIPYIGISV